MAREEKTTPSPRAKISNTDVYLDRETTVFQLRELVEAFVARREWQQFHSPKNLAMAIGVEAGELMDLFRWRTESESVDAMRRAATRKAAAEELADVVICALSFANRAGIDVAQAVRWKVIKNSRKYPAHKYKGHF